MNHVEVSKKTIARKGMATVRKGVAKLNASTPVLEMYLRVGTQLLRLYNVVENGDTSSTAHSVLTMVVHLGENLIGLGN